MSLAILQYHPGRADGLSLTWEIRHASGSLDGPFASPCGPLSEVLESARRFKDELGRCAAAFSEDPAWGDGLRQALNGLLALEGELLSKLLLPPELVAALGASPRPAVEFQFGEQLCGVPWHALRLGGEFIGFSHPVTQWFLTEAGPRPSAVECPHTQQPRGVGWVVDPGGLLPERVAEEFMAFSRAWPAGRSGRLAAHPHSQSVREDWDLGRFGSFLASFDHFIFLGHNLPGSGGLQLGVDQAFGLEQFALALKNPTRRPPEGILCLACRSADLSAGAGIGRKLYGLADAATKSGCSYFVGGIVDIPALAACWMLEPFFATLAEGISSAEAMRKSRNVLRARDFGTGILGLMLAHYGRAKVASPRLCHVGHLGLSVTDPLISCEQPGCGALVCVQCSGYAHSRCWRHVSHSGKKILNGIFRTCDDPFGLHPKVRGGKGEPRSIAGTDLEFVLRTIFDGSVASGYLCKECSQKNKENQQRRGFGELTGSHLP